jgi:hypothetical protein
MKELTDTFARGAFLIPVPLGFTPMNSWSPGTETKTGEATLQDNKSDSSGLVVTVTKNRNEMKVTIVLLEDSGTRLLNSLKKKNLKGN